MNASSSTIEQRMPATDMADGPALPRLLAGIQPRRSMTLQEHAQHHGPLPVLRRGGRRRGRERSAMLIDECERSGLLGHGGAAFPLASKMRAVAAARGRAIVLANGAEGEPASRKDRLLLEGLPQLVLDGGLIAAEALDADELVVCVCETAEAALHSMGRAIEEREAAIAPSRGAPRLRLASVPAHYVAGQESALISHLSGGPAKPTFTPPRPSEQGLRRRPTLVNNLETLSHLALIARHGAPWFRELGAPAHPGSALVTLSGPVPYPGVYEIEHGASLRSLIDAGGGTTAPVRAALIGGYAGTWIDGRLLSGVALSNEHLAVHDASLGAGVVLLLSAEACPVAETLRSAEWLAGQSTGQCGPCVNGLPAIARTLAELAAGRGGRGAGERIQQLAALTARRGACGHPDGAVKLILSALRVFRGEFAEHARRGPCELCARAPEMPLPRWLVSG